jgi:tetratricopeptide (TPR) repeat protein
MKDILTDNLTLLHEPFGRDHDRLRAQLMSSLPSGVPQERHSYWREIQNLLIGDITMTMPRRILRLSPALAAIAIAMGLAVYFGFGAKPAFALEQVGEALRSVRYMHATVNDEQGQTSRDIWIEINSDGLQVKYRAEGKKLLIADNGDAARCWDRSANVVYVDDSGHYEWIGDMGAVLRDLSGKGASGSAEIERNVQYKGRPAHRVRLMRLNMDCYIDPETKLPMTIGAFEIAYGQPPPGTFELAIPDGVAVVDRRSGKASGESQQVKPTWEATQDDFEKARYALAEKDYETAEALFAKVSQRESRHNWAFFWLGRCRYEQGNFDGAIEAYTKVIKMLGTFGHQPPYEYLARGLAYQKKGMQEEATKDFAKALPDMIKGLRNPQVSLTFDNADDPTLGYRLIMRNVLEHRKIVKERERTAQGRMIERLKAVTGQDLGFAQIDTPEQQAQAIAAWENWWQQHAADYGVKPEKLEPYTQAKTTELEASAAEEALAEKVFKYRWGKEAEKVALELFEEAKQVHPKDPDLDLWWTIGLELYDAKHYQEALEAFDQAVNLQGDKPRRYGFGRIVWQGHMLDLLGQREKAVERYKEALRQYPGDAHRIQHDNWGIWIDKKWIKERLETPFSRK